MARLNEKQDGRETGETDEKTTQAIRFIAIDVPMTVLFIYLFF